MDYYVCATRDGRSLPARSRAHVVVDTPFLRTISWRVPPLYEPWLGSMVANHATRESERFHFFRIPEPRISIALLIGPGRAKFLVSGATLKLHAVPPFLRRACREEGPGSMTCPKR
jgi:hypothetical protein